MLRSLDEVHGYLSERFVRPISMDHFLAPFHFFLINFMLILLLLETSAVKLLSVVKSTELFGTISLLYATIVPVGMYLHLNL